MSDDTSDAAVDGQANQESEGADSEEDGECFVIAPIGDPRSETRRQTDGLLDEAIRPVVEDRLDLKVTAAHQLPEAGSITRQVIQRLLEVELVVADLTRLNANVMYELAVRHAKGRPVVPIAEKSTSLPFDITTERTVFYEDSMHGLGELKPKLEKAARAALGDKEPDNPIYRAQQDFEMRKAAEGDIMEYVIDRLDEIESSVSTISHSRDSGIDEVETHEFVMEEAIKEVATLASDVNQDPKVISASVVKSPGPGNCRLRVRTSKDLGIDEAGMILRKYL
ncbi:hypothetical protein BSZ35_19140 [Salinibacter sp. 10B]|uniref:hypothetical protein n=1 Tax=Salinibacter sp. 10B TaxID=1923971 RepID=UPI000CF4CDE5|nr:hypothetical protein [Salinibacter sp. 10B]PQJ26765.1 hypothetical protein BSZ35_19140 [Salinibacter sp. 10B]